MIFLIFDLFDAVFHHLCSHPLLLQGIVFILFRPHMVNNTSELVRKPVSQCLANTRLAKDGKKLKTIFMMLPFVLKEEKKKLSVKFVYICLKALFKYINIKWVKRKRKFCEAEALGIYVFLKYSKKERKINSITRNVSRAHSKVCL